MKTLVIHPRDVTTDSLKAVYSRIDAEVVRDTGDADMLYRKIEESDRVICLGHGLPQGLIGTGMRLCIDARHAELFRRQRNNVYIWCNATNYLADHGLTGFASGMFISEPNEAWVFNVPFNGREIDDSNDLFSTLVGESVARGDSPDETAKNVLEKYVGAAPVIAYNRPLLASFKDGRKTMNEAIWGETSSHQPPQFSVAAEWEFPRFVSASGSTVDQPREAALVVRSGP